VGDPPDQRPCGGRRPVQDILTDATGATHHGAAMAMSKDGKILVSTSRPQRIWEPTSRPSGPPYRPFSMDASERF